MNLRIVATVMSLGIAACATSGSDSPDPGAPDTYSDTNETSTATADEAEIAGTPTMTGVAKPPARNKVSCRMEKRTGSHRARRVCYQHTISESDAAEARDSMKVLRREQY